jgi:ElaB/YqjD/DUF883 family membrane-anchored ribosome-binding protein
MFMAKSQDDVAKELRDFIKRAEEQLEGLEDKGKHAFSEIREREESFEDFVKKNPLLAVGGALVVGYALGRMLKRGK